MAERNSGHARDPFDWYVEPAWCAHRLFNHIHFTGGIHDPCAGVGTIVDAALARGKKATGADIQDRATGRFPVRDFLSDQNIYPNIVTNPPFRDATAIVRHAQTLVPFGGQIAVIAQAKFLMSQSRFDLFTNPGLDFGCERVLVFSRRPSMPTGVSLVEHGEAIRGGGSIDFVWVIWRVGSDCTQTVIDWML